MHRGLTEYFDNNLTLAPLDGNLVTSVLEIGYVLGCTYYLGCLYTFGSSGSGAW